ncbi:hypothetical protein GCM10007931_05000 [Vibrio algivorus]|uniref:Uncharacterized protein n=1 Tax=Vibrio algivorus TaxID=1667024 RepID=A0ABQ6ELC6_9VIBR|nr:hypothetical protein GCM10007931_05000 [Vibrio algivorus]
MPQTELASNPTRATMICSIMLNVANSAWFEIRIIGCLVRKLGMHEAEIQLRYRLVSYTE